MDLKVGILTVSDRVHQGTAEDKSGPAIRDYLIKNKAIFKFASSLSFTTEVVPDEEEIITDTLISWADKLKLHLILTTGGTGFAPRDITPEATKGVIDKEAPGIQIAMIQASLKITPYAMLSRPVAGIRNKTLIINLPGSEKAVTENLDAIIAALPHALSLLLELPKANESHKYQKTKHDEAEHSHSSSHSHHCSHSHKDEMQMLSDITKKDIAKVVEHSLDLNAIASEVADPKAGAIATFSGTTRDHHGGKKVLRLEYEAYVPMAEKVMRQIIEEMRRRWQLIHVALYHKIGEVPIKETSVVVAVSSIHRKDALEACQFGIDEIKAKVPIWKKEFYEDGSCWRENQEWRDRHRC